MFPSGDVSVTTQKQQQPYILFNLVTSVFQALSDKIQRNASRLKPDSILLLDFEKVLSIDGGATLGLVDGITFSLKFNPTLKIQIENIKVILTA